MQILVVTSQFLLDAQNAQHSFRIFSQDARDFAVFHINQSNNCQKFRWMGTLR